jgi:hypothetical protein
MKLHYDYKGVLYILFVLLVNNAKQHKLQRVCYVTIYVRLYWSDTLLKLYHIFVQ